MATKTDQDLKSILEKVESDLDLDDLKRMVELKAESLATEEADKLSAEAENKIESVTDPQAAPTALTEVSPSPAADAQPSIADSTHVPPTTDDVTSLLGRLRLDASSGNVATIVEWVVKHFGLHI